MNSDHLAAVLRDQVLAGVAEHRAGSEGRDVFNIASSPDVTGTACKAFSLYPTLAGRDATTTEASIAMTPAGVKAQAKRWVIGRCLARTEAECVVLPGSLTSNGVRDVTADMFSILETWRALDIAAPGAVVYSQDNALNECGVLTVTTIGDLKEAWGSEGVQSASLVVVAPPSLDKVLVAQLNELEHHTRRPNWDFENALAIPSSDWRAARRLCEAVVLAVPQAPVPVPAPCGDGTIHLRWSRGKTDVVVELKGDHGWWTCKGPERRREGEFSDPQCAVDLLRETFA